MGGSCWNPSFLFFWRTRSGWFLHHSERLSDAPPPPPPPGGGGGGGGFPPPPPPPPWRAGRRGLVSPRQAPGSGLPSPGPGARVGVPRCSALLLSANEGLLKPSVWRGLKGQLLHVPVEPLAGSFRWCYEYGYYIIQYVDINIYKYAYIYC